MRPPGGSFVTACAFALALAVTPSCSSTISAGDDRAPLDASAVSVTTGDAGGAVVAASPDAGQCNAYECPLPYATCPGTSGLCTTNLSNDVAHCGSCDNECPNSLMIRRQLHASFICATGRCLMLCTPLAGDCNHLVDDGCETSLDKDPANCGLCGNACDAGVICWRGACGCPSGYTQCGNDCVKLVDDDSNCGACGHACETPPLDAGPSTWLCGPGVYPPNVGFNCATSTCGLHCASGFGNCNADVCGDGCETALTDDHENCGSCGHACAPEQICAQGKCICDDDSRTRCGSECVDLQSDANNCGACGNACPGLVSDGFVSGPQGSPVCVLGRCTYHCPPGFADCDHRIENGCEVDLSTDPQNCGACGAHCDVAHGQPCAAGQCLTKPCAPGGVF